MLNKIVTWHLQDLGRFTTRYRAAPVELKDDQLLGGDF